MEDYGHIFVQNMSSQKINAVFAEKGTPEDWKKVFEAQPL